MNTAKVQCKQIIIKVFVLDDSFVNGTVGVREYSGAQGTVPCVD